MKINFYLTIDLKKKYNQNFKPLKYYFFIEKN